MQDKTREYNIKYCFSKIFQHLLTIFGLYFWFGYSIEPKYFGIQLNRNFGPYRHSKMNRNLGLGLGSKPNFGRNLNRNLNIPITSLEIL